MALSSPPSSSPPPPPLLQQPPHRKLRLLCLHGFRTSGSILRSQLSKWDPSIRHSLDLVFPNAPFDSRGKSDVEDFFEPPYYEWFQYERNEDVVKYTNLDQCIDFITNYMEAYGPFDGLLGFSQGAFLSAALAGMQQQGLALTSLPRLRCVIIISGGILLGDHKWKECYSEPISCPSVHFIGEHDFLKHANEKLLLAFANPIVVRHGAKHTVPRLDKESASVLKSFMEETINSIEENGKRKDT